MWANANMMAALSNIGGALCATPQSLADARYWSAVQQRCQQVQPIAGVPQTLEPISAASRPKFTILCGHVEILLLRFSNC